MLVVDASCLYEVVADTHDAEVVRRRLAADADHAAPHVIDAEVLGVVRRHHLAGLLDATAARQAVDDLRRWPGDRYGHRVLLDRAWQLRHAVRSWDALYVALAEALDATLLTRDRRLASVTGIGCAIEVVEPPGRRGSSRDPPAELRRARGCPCRSRAPLSRPRPARDPQVTSHA